MTFGTLTRVGPLAGLLALLALFAASTPAAAQTGLQFNGTSQSVTFGNSATLNVSSFTLECWFQRTGASANTSTGTGGWAAIAPLVTKGRGEGETPANLNMNYFLGIRSDGVLCADFEEAAGPNHPLGGVRVIPQNVWHHAAVTYDVASGQYRLYLNGQLEKDTTLTAGLSPASTSIQHAGLATAMTSAGAAAGFFNGRLDEVRIWSVARTGAEIASGLAAEIASGADLVARWGLNEGAGSTAANSVAGAAAGTLVNAPGWVAGSPFALAYGLAFGGTTGNYVTFGANPALGLPQFTLECWFRRDGAGVAVSTGTGGVTAVPLMAKGGAEAETPANVNMNWFLGIRGGDNVLVADFEEGAAGGSPGLNHPVAGTTPILAGSGWHHAAATYDGATWQLYLDGLPEATLAVGQPVESGSIQHAGLGAIFTSTGAASGAFAGALDEVRVWNVARSTAQVQADLNAQLAGADPALVARWGMSEGAGATIASTAGTTVTGALTGAGVTWTAGAPFNLVITPPSPPADPTGLAATATAHNHVSLAWTDNATNEASYEVERSTTGAGGPFSPLATLPANTASYEDEPLVQSSEYCYRVRAVNGLGPSSWAGPACATTPATQQLAFDFPGAGAYVTFGNATALDLPVFTVECWFRRDGAGATTSTGTGGATAAVPLVANGRGEAEDTNRDLNWFLGIDTATNTLVADFEEGAGSASPSLNHPVSGVTPLPADGTWHHAAAAYDGSTWTLYLDGCLEATLFVGQPCASASTQQASIGSALTSTGVAAGFFDGAIDEVRVWNVARTPSEVRFGMLGPLTGVGLVADWRLDDEVGANVYAAAGPNGTLVGAIARPAGTPFGDFRPPSVAATYPVGGETLVVGTVENLAWTASDCFAVQDVTLELSRSGPAGPWEAIATQAPNTGTYAWTVTGPQTATNDAWLRVTARDGYGNTSSDLCAAGFTIFDLATPTVVALFSFTPGPEGNSVSWQLARPELVASAALQRAGGAAGPWQAVTADPRQDGARVTVLDRDVEPGREYWYRLDVVTSDGGTLRFGPVSGVSERVAEFAMSPPSPSPTKGRLAISLALPAGSRARVRVLDVQGRTCATLLDGTLPAGVHRLEWNGESDAGPLGPGVYFAAADLGGRRFVKRFVIAR